MAVWVVVLEALVDEDAAAGFEAEGLDALADALADNYPVVAGTGTSYEAELWVEDNMASGALLTAERLVQLAAREVGLATTQIVRAEVRSAQALEEGVIEWGAPPGQRYEPADKAGAKKAGTKKKAGAKKAGAAGTAPRKARSRGL